VVVFLLLVLVLELELAVGFSLQAAKDTREVEARAKRDCLRKASHRPMTIRPPVPAFLSPNLIESTKLLLRLIHHILFLSSTTKHEEAYMVLT
jgi:hypothetical protein